MHDRRTAGTTNRRDGGSRPIRDAILLKMQTLEKPVIGIIDYERGELLSLVQGSKQAIRTKFNPDDVALTDTPIVAFEELRNLRSGSEWELGWKEIEGRPAEGFRLHKDGMEWTVWADPDTNFPIIVEMEGEFSGQTIKAMMSEFTFDEPLDPSLFSLEIPEGFTELKVPGQIDVSEPDEEDLINGLQWLIESGMDVFPPDLDLATLMSLIQKAGSGSSGSSDQTFEETMAKTLEITSKIVRMQQFVQGKQNVNAWNYSPDVRVGDESAPLCWWRGESGDDYRVVFGDLSARNLGEEELNRMKSAQSEPGVEVPSVQ